MKTKKQFKHLDNKKFVQFFQLYSEAQKIGTWYWDFSNDSIFCNDVLYHIYEIDRKKFTANFKSWINMIHPDDRNKILCDIQTIIKTGTLKNVDFRITTPNGKLKYIRWSAFLEKNSKNQPSKMFGINQDVTMEHEQEKEIEHQRLMALNTSKLASLGEMVGGIAHEINNPLAIIMGKAHQLKRLIKSENSNTNQILDELDKITLTSLRIEKIIKNLRTFSRSENNLQAFELTSVESLLQNTLDLCQQRFKTHGIELKIPMTADIKIECRPLVIEQVLVNLLNNSFDAIYLQQDSWVKIDFSEHDDKIQIKVTDSGKGIPTEIRDKIMNPFFTTKDPGKGTGIGLSISKQIIEDHDGLLYIDTRCHNTSFVIELPKYQNRKNQNKIAA